MRGCARPVAPALSGGWSADGIGIIHAKVKFPPSPVLMPIPKRAPLFSSCDKLAPCP